MTRPDVVTVRELVLQPLLAIEQKRVSGQVLAGAEWHVAMEQAANAVMVRLMKYVLSERLSGDVEVPVFVPITIPHRRSLLQWLARGSKVRQITVQARLRIPVASYNTFPECDIPYPPELGRPVRVQLLEEPEVYA